jgi:lipopolysaccharide export LptBFGC system permease protein LptF
MMQDSSGNLFNAGLYTAPTSTSPAEVQILDVIERDSADLHPTGHLLAERAVWNDDKQLWELTGGKHVAISSPNQPTTRGDDLQTDVSVYQSDINPQEISLYLSKDFIQFLSIADLNLLLHRGKSYGTANLLRTWDMRWTQPLANIILLALAISSTLTREPGRLKHAVTKCMILTTLCMGTIFVTYELAGNAPNPQWISLWPALMAWIPIFIFGPLAALLMRRLPT